MFDKMKQLMDMQRIAQQAERRLDELRVERSALGGRLKVELTGTHRVTGLSISESLLSPGQKDALETALAALLTEAAEAVRKEAAFRALEMMKEMTPPAG